MEHIAQIVPYIILLVVILVIMSGIKIANEHERFVVNVLGRYIGLKGPGLLIKWPGSSSTWHRVTLGDEGIYLGDGLVKVGDTVFPVEGANAYKTNTKVHVSSFSSGRIDVTQC